MHKETESKPGLLKTSTPAKKALDFLDECISPTMVLSELPPDQMAHRDTIRRALLVADAVDSGRLAKWIDVYDDDVQKHLGFNECLETLKKIGTES